MKAEHIQEMLFKIILDRSEFMSESVLLGEDYCGESRLATFYLLLPVIFHRDANTVSVDWTVISRCLSSPIFGISARGIDSQYIRNKCLQLDNGCWSVRDVQNSLVYTKHNNLFYFVTNILPGMNGHSPCRGQKSSSHVEYFMKT